jgi:hypothetical protein
MLFSKKQSFFNLLANLPVKSDSLNAKHFFDAAGEGRIYDRNSIDMAALVVIEHWS